LVTTGGAGGTLPRAGHALRAGEGVVPGTGTARTGASLAALGATSALSRLRGDRLLGTRLGRGRLLAARLRCGRRLLRLLLCRSGGRLRGGVARLLRRGLHTGLGSAGGLGGR